MSDKLREQMNVVGKNSYANFERWIDREREERVCVCVIEKEKTYGNQENKSMSPIMHKQK